MNTKASASNDYRYTLVQRNGPQPMRIHGTRHDVVTEFKVANALLYANKHGSLAAARHLANNGVPLDLARKVLLRTSWRSTDHANNDAEPADVADRLRERSTA